MNKSQVGKRGEQAAAKYLKAHGYDVIEKNLHISHQEIDIVALNRDCIVFVEVKTRTIHPEDADRFSTPAAAVTQQKQQFLLKAASKYIIEHEYALQPRMDVIEVYLAPDQEISPLQEFWERLSGIFGIPKRKVLHINHIENAFGYRRHR